MNGPDHYREAERLLELVQSNAIGRVSAEEARGMSSAVAMAQVHATLATVDEDTMQMWESLRLHMLGRIGEDRAVDTFRRVWAEADARGEHGTRVRQALAAVVSEVLL